MAKNQSFYSDIYPSLYDLLNERAGNTRPNQLGSGGVSGLTPFIRLLSGVDNGLILQPVYQNENFELRYGSETGPGIIGVDFDGNPLRVTGRGLRPAPVITSLEVEESKDGFRTCDLSITAYTTEQVDFLSSYLLEPGFHLLVEWGWNTNDGISQIVGNGGSVTPCDLAKYDQWRYIKTKREESNFHYDACLGFVGGGGISFGEDETYEITIKTRGIGEIAEYMQVHRTSPNTSSTDSDSSKIFNPEQIENTEDLGQRLFKLMFNRLPSDKQMSSVKAMSEDSKWTDVANFVNMDPEVVEDFHGRLSDAQTLYSRTTDEVKIPTDVPLLSKEGFIRLELAFEILNKYAVPLEPVNSGDCEKFSRNKKIRIDKTVIRAFPHMFSTDKTKLFIPNTKAPNFKFIESLSQIDNLDQAKEFISFENLDSEENLQNLHPPTAGGGETPYAFPSIEELTGDMKPVNQTDETFIPPTAKPYFWGWLRNLYINFDFFCEVISKPNFFIRDVVYELLNGLSSSCNSLWNFQIVESPEENGDGDHELVVIDASFNGEVDFESDTIKAFQTRGVNSPFQDISFNVDMEGDLMSSIFQARMEQDTEGNVEGRDSFHYRASVFGDKKVDNVGKILQNWADPDDGSGDGDGAESASAGGGVGGSSEQVGSGKTDLDDSEKRKQIYQILTQKAGVFLKIQDREISGNLDVKRQMFDFNSGNNANIEDILFLGTWNDPLALKKIYYIDLGRHEEIEGYEGRTKEDSLKFNPPFGGMGDISFVVDGVSGFKPSDRFKLIGLPENFSSGIFQITDISQGISQDGWITSISATFVPQAMVQQQIITE